MRLARGSPGAGHNGPVRSDRSKVAPEPGWASGHERRYRDEPDRRSARAVAPTPFAQYQEIGLLSCWPPPEPSAGSRPSALSDFLADELAGRSRSSVALRRRSARSPTGKTFESRDDAISSVAAAQPDVPDNVQPRTARRALSSDMRSATGRSAPRELAAADRKTGRDPGL